MKSNRTKTCFLFIFFIITGFSLVCVHNSCTPASRRIHVSPQGNNSNPGTASLPLKTIQAAANLAQPGDIVTVHEGVYRENVQPPRGGLSPQVPIVFEAAKGESVEIKGSEPIKHWEKLDGNTWMVKIPDRFFGDFNPYTDTIHGDWLESGKWCHTGEVYVNGTALKEVQELEHVLSDETGKKSWYCNTKNDTTSIWANFDTNPNEALVEINVRRSVFYPRNPFVNFIHVRGFKLSQAATPWAPPTCEQVGLIGTHWSKGWVIENNTVTHSKCVGITLGKYGDEWDNKSESVEGYTNTVRRALENNWNKETIGSHIVRNNTISHCGQAGIAGSLGAIFSEVTGNTIFNIGTDQLFWGYEIAGIKFHAPVDMLISNNHIHHTEGGIWLDWMAQGTRVSKNLLHDNNVQDFSLEVNHGPILVDNNLFLSEELAQVKLSQGVAFINNLIAWKIWPTGTEDPRETPVLAPHGTQIEASHKCPCGDVYYYNNIFTRIDMSPYEACSLPVKMQGNLFLSGAIPFKGETAPYVNPDFSPGIRVSEESDGWYLEMNLPDEWMENKTSAIINTKNLEHAVITKQSFDREDGSPIVFDTDYLNNKKNPSRPCPGPIEFSTGGKQKIKVFPR